MRTPVPAGSKARGHDWSLCCEAPSFARTASALSTVISAFVQVYRVPQWRVNPFTLVEHARDGEAERLDHRVEGLALVGDHLEAAVHGADRRSQRAAAGVLELLAGLE